MPLKTAQAEASGESGASGASEPEEDMPEMCVSPGGTLQLTTSNCREMRNRAEKQRRDRLNAFIGELAQLVPLVSKSTKRLDKTSILRLTAVHLRLNQTLTQGKGVPHMELPKYIDHFLLDQLICDEMGGFLLILCPNGKIIFVSHTVEALLGHPQTDLMGQSLFTLTAPEDQDKLRIHLQSEGELDSEWRKYLNVSIKRAGPRSEAPVYEYVRMVGVHRHLGDMNETCDTSSSASTNSIQAQLNTDILVFFVKLCRPEPLADRLIAVSRDEYVTRHLIDGRIVNCDQRISLIAGYMIEEVNGQSAFMYMHKDDVKWVMIALRQMYDRGESTGSSCYRLKSRNGEFIYLKTFGYLEIDNQGIVESFVCVNSLVEEPEGKALIDSMRRRFSALINSAFTCLPQDQVKSAGTTTTTTTFQALNWVAKRPQIVPPSDQVEDPMRIQEAVSQLVSNLPSPEEGVGSPGSSNCQPPPPVAAPVCQVTEDCNSVAEQNSTNAGKAPHLRLKSGCKRQAPTTPEPQPNCKRSKNHSEGPQFPAADLRSPVPYPKAAQTRTNSSTNDQYDVVKQYHQQSQPLDPHLA